MTSIEGTPAAPPPDGGAEEVRKLRRSRSNRWFAGVAGGLAEYFGLSATVYRVLFVALAFAGGTGILLYVAALLVMPAEDAEESVLSAWLARHRNRPWLVIGLALLALVLIWVVSGFHAEPGRGGPFFWPGAPIFWLLIAGIVLLVAWGARGGRRRLAVALALVTALVAAPIAGALALASAHGGVGERTAHPTVATDLEQRYELGLGDLRLDLRDVTLPKGETRVDVRLGVGEAEVILPPNVAVRVNAKVKWGDASVLGVEDEGRGLDRVVTEPGFEQAERRLVIDARMRAGDLNIHR